MNETKPAIKSKLTAAILAYILGGLGLHFFYLRKTGWGLGFLLGNLLTGFLLAPIFSTVAFVQGVLLLNRPNEDFDQEYNQQALEQNKELRTLQPPINQHVTALMAFFAGISGLHKFYTGKITQGIIYLVVGLIIPLFIYFPGLLLTAFISGFTIDSSSATSGISLAIFFIFYFLLIIQIITVQIVALVEGVIYLFMDKELFDQKYNM